MRYNGFSVVLALSSPTPHWPLALTRTPSGRVPVVVLRTKRISRKCVLYAQHCSVLSGPWHCHGIRNEVGCWKMKSDPCARSRTMLGEEGGGDGDGGGVLLQGACTGRNSPLSRLNFANLCGGADQGEETIVRRVKDDGTSMRLNCGSRCRGFIQTLSG